MTPLEKAARAYAVAEGHAASFDAVDAEYRGWCMEVARAVLMAVRDCGPDAARRVGRAAWHSGSVQRPENVWAVGIDAILAEEPK